MKFIEENKTSNHSFDENLLTLKEFEEIKKRVEKSGYFFEEKKLNKEIIVNEFKQTNGCSLSLNTYTAKNTKRPLLMLSFALHNNHYGVCPFPFVDTNGLSKKAKGIITHTKKYFDEMGENKSIPASYTTVGFVFFEGKKIIIKNSPYYSFLEIKGMN